MANRVRTAKQKAALRKAQLASARKRRGKGKGKLARANRRITRYKRTRNALIVAAAVGGAAAYAGRYAKKNVYTTKFSSTNPKRSRSPIKLQKGRNPVTKARHVTISTKKGLGRQRGYNSLRIIHDPYYVRNRRRY